MKIIIKLVSTLLATLLIMAGLSALSMTAAHADSTVPQSCLTADESSNEGFCIDDKEASSSSENVGFSIAGVNLKGKILTRYFAAAGIKLKKAEKKNNKCKLYTSFALVPAGATCFRAKRGFKYTNSGIDQAGNTKYWADYVGSPTSSTPNAKWMRFVKRGNQWYKAGDQTGKGNCANPVRFTGKPPKLTWKNVINIKSFADWTFKGKVTVKASSKAESEAKAWCSVAGASASAWANGMATATATASASYKLKGLAKIQQWASAKSIELQQQLKLKVLADAKATARTRAVSSSWAKAKCQGNPPTIDSNPPTIEASSTVCVKPGQQSGIIVVTVRNPNPKADVAHVSVGGKSQTREVQANSQVSFSLTGFAPGTFVVTAKLTNINKSVTTQVTVVQCPPDLTCPEVYGPGYSGEYPNCTKDGTTTPAPPPSAPGPNPAPSPQDPSPTPSACFDPITWLPVPPTTPGAACM